jgi:predicted transcriptional regulator
VLEAIRDNPGITLKELIEVVGTSQNLARTILYRLKAEGYIERAGKGYVLTKRGESFLKFLETQKSGEVEEVEAKTQPTSATPVQEPEQLKLQVREQTTSQDVLEAISNLEARLRELERRVASLESTVRSLEHALATYTQKKRETLTIEPPVQPYSDAVSRYGVHVDKLLSEGKLMRVGGLVVDASFYENFKSKFPIRVSDVERLDPHEKALLEEMRREALVVLHAGREYRLVS